MVISLLIGFTSGLLEIEFLRSRFVILLPIILFIFPSFLEESFFRGILIPINTKEQGKKKIIFYICLSTLSFVLWHPLNALTINPTAKIFFLDPYFLLITCLLGLTCSFSYIYSRSLWLPILIHWATVVVWVIFLGGRNMVLEL
jgi:predicted Abi (CAAX) family protease